MATTNFYLQPETKEGFSQVILVYQNKGKKFKISTKIKVRKTHSFLARLKAILCAYNLAVTLNLPI